MHNNPLISIAMCTYNGEKFLAKQIESILAQTYRPIEIVVVDDCSSDSTCNMLDDYAEKYAELKVYKNNQNLGYIRNFEKALSLCNGDYVALADQDDIWLPNKIAVQYENIDKCSLTYSLLSFIDEEDQPIFQDFKNNRLSGKCNLGLLFHTCVTGHLILATKEAIKLSLPFPDHINAHDRWIPFVAASLNGIAASDEVLSYYRHHNSNVSRKKRNILGFLANKNIFSHRDLSLEKRLSFLKNCLDSGLLSAQEYALVTEIYSLNKQLKYKFYNKALRKILLDNKDVLLSQYVSPVKAAKKLSKAKPAYVIKFYIYHLIFFPFFMCGKIIRSFFNFR